MKIAHVIDSGGIFGAEVVLMKLIEMQMKESHKPVLISLGRKGDGPKEIEGKIRSKGVECVPLRICRGFIPANSIELAHTAEELGADVIHSHGYKGDILLGMLPRCLRKIPVVTTLHGWTYRQAFTRLWFYRLLDIIAIRNLESIVSVSSTLAKQPLLRLCGVHPVVITNGIPVLDFKETSLPQEYLDIIANYNNKLKIISIGRLSEEKGIDILIQSIAHIVAHSIDVKLVLIGEGGQKEKLIRLTKELNISDQVEFWGYQNEAYRFLPYFDVFALPSYTEGFPITLLEAMQSGIRIVASRVGDVPFILDNGRLGSLVNPGDHVSLSLAIMGVENDCKNVLSRGHKAKEIALEEYSIQRMNAQYLNEYKKAIHHFRE
jgi:glycosyltransferase involved in cell wall biosynthesis